MVVLSCTAFEKEKKMQTVLRFLKDERGTETVEWAIVIGLIATGAIALAMGIGTKVQGAFQRLSDGMALMP
jgi:Flp pilus assembly pilin Flp